MIGGVIICVMDFYVLLVSYVICMCYLCLMLSAIFVLGYYFYLL